MCGVAALLLESPNAPSPSDLIELIMPRGPDCFGHYYLPQSLESTFVPVLYASTLHIQGENMTQQPLSDEEGNVICWNGEVFSGVDIPVGTSDTLIVLEALSGYSEDVSTSLHECGLNICSYLSEISGPYSFIFYSRKKNAIIFGRDPFGRRSLAGFWKEDTLIALCSICGSSKDSLESDYCWGEITVEGIFVVDLSLPIYKVSCIPWPLGRLRLGRGPACITDNFTSLDDMELSSQFLDILRRAVMRRCNVLKRRSVCSRHSSSVYTEEVQSCCSIGVLFSGGIDSVLLAAVLHQCLDEGESIDLINVTFDNDDCSTKFGKLSDDSSVTVDADHSAVDEITDSLRRTKVGTSLKSPDRLAAIAAYVELKALFPSRQWRLVHVDVNFTERIAMEGRISSLIAPAETHMDLNIGTAFWFASRAKGYIRHYNLSDSLAAYSESTCGRPLLRRGGSDAAKSVGLELTRSPRGLQRLPCHNGKCKRISKPGCNWNLCKRCCLNGHFRVNCSNDYIEECPVHKAVKSNISISLLSNNELVNTFSRSQDVSPSTDNSSNIEIIHNITPPLSVQFTAMSQIDHEIDSEVLIDQLGIICDPCSLSSSDSIGKGTTECERNDPSMDFIDHRNPESSHSDGLTTVSDHFQPYQSCCKALLIGIGADEQMAGYGRHRTVFQKGGEVALEQELAMDMERLWKRNLGRDDRCISDHGREAWFPYLDEELVSFLQSLPISKIANLTMEQGFGDKRILRDAAKLIGLKGCTELVKRAIQFGTLIAKHTNVLHHGSNRKGKGETKLPSRK